MTAAFAYSGVTASWATDPAGLCEVVLHREPLNELGEESLAELERLVVSLSGSGALPARALLIRSARPSGFSAGADLRALHQAIEERGHEAVAKQLRTFLDRINAVFTVLDESPVPSVAALHGVVFGGGFELALACDLRVADRTARLAFPELRLGLIPGFGGLPRLRREVGAGRALDLLLTGRSLSAERAREAGLVAQVVARGKHVDVARRVARQLARQEPAAVAAAKRHAKGSVRSALPEQIDTFCRLFARPECARALAEFASRSDPLPFLPRAPEGEEETS